MKTRLVVVWLAATLCGAAWAAGGLAALSSAEKSDALKGALEQAVVTAVASLGKAEGFSANPEVRIPLPGSLQKAAKKLRKIGAKKQVDALELAMNRAAEAAVPQARELLVQSVKQMSFKDAMTILTGPQDSATQYFRQTMSEPLTQKFFPIVSKATTEVQVARYYKEAAGKASALGLVDEQDASLDAYITRKALDGLFLTMAKEEAAIRRDPLGQANVLLRKVFGAIGMK
jgi:hypothetical protein